MTTDLKRLVILMPEDELIRLQKISSERHESMSNLGRRLIIEWMDKEYPDSKPDKKLSST